MIKIKTFCSFGEWFAVIEEDEFQAIDVGALVSGSGESEKEAIESAVLSVNNLIEEIVNELEKLKKIKNGKLEEIKSEKR